MPSTVYQKTWPTPVASGPIIGVTPEAGSSRKAKPLQHARSRKVDVHRVLEDDIHHRKAEGRRRADGAHVRQPLQVYCKWIGDLVLHFLRTAPLPLGEDDNLVFAEVGNRVDRRVNERQ